MNRPKLSLANPLLVKQHVLPFLPGLIKQGSRRGGSLYQKTISPFKECYEYSERKKLSK